jgi:hypothetical protein
MSSTFSGGMGDPSLTTFSPAECLVGGIFIGISVVARAFALGTVTGISGIFGSTIRFESLEKAFFSVGVFLSGVALFWGSPAPFLRVPDNLPVYRPIVAAILVAIGTHYGNGCTRCSARVSCNLIFASRGCASDALTQWPRHMRDLAAQRPLIRCSPSIHVRMLPNLMFPLFTSRIL